MKKGLDEKYNINENIFDKDCEEKYYWLGFIYGDGYINKNRLQLALGIVDILHLEKLCIFLGNKKRPIRIFEVDGNNYCEVRIRNNTLRDSFEKYEITVNKEDREKNIIGMIPEEYIRFFLRGLFDADGCIGFLKENRWGFCELTGREYLIKDILNYLGSINIIENNKLYKNGSIYRIRFNKDESKRFLKYIYFPNCNIYLNRKYEKFLLYFNKSYNPEEINQWNLQNKEKLK